MPDRLKFTSIVGKNTLEKTISTTLADQVFCRSYVYRQHFRLRSLALLYLHRKHVRIIIIINAGGTPRRTPIPSREE